MAPNLREVREFPSDRTNRRTLLAPFRSVFATLKFWRLSEPHSETIPTKVGIHIRRGYRPEFILGPAKGRTRGPVWLSK